MDVWENIIRTSNMADLQKSLHIQYINSPESMKKLDVNVMILVFISHRESAEYVLQYLQRIVWEYSIAVFAESEEYLEAYQAEGYKCCITYEKNLSEILTQFSEYEFVCVIHDTDMTSDKRYSCTGKSYFYNIWENLLKDAVYISGVLEQFIKEPYLGFLTSPQPNFADFFGMYGKEWDDNYEKVCEITKKLHLDCQISPFIPPFRVVNDFWIRGSILKKLCKIEKREDIYLSYLWTYLSQDAGYYSGIIESAEYASINEVNLQYYLQKITSQIRRQWGEFNNFSELQKVIRLCALERFCGKYSTIFVYGIGEVAENYKSFLPMTKAYIVSDGQRKPEYFEGIPVKYLSEINEPDSCGVVLCLNRKHQMEVLPFLKKQGLKHYFCL